MARPIWKGHISFGLVSVPVELYSAEVIEVWEASLTPMSSRVTVRCGR